MNRRSLLFICILIPLLSMSCGPKVMIPPNVDLTRYDRVGVIGFGCNADGKMDEYFKRRFLLRVRSYQKDARIIDLGSEEEILMSAETEWIDSRSIQAIARRHNVDAIFTGDLEVVEVWPLVVYSPLFRPPFYRTMAEGMRCKAVVTVCLTLTLWETRSGTRIWRTSACREEMVDQVKVVTLREVIFDAGDPYKAFWDLVNPLVKEMCADFKIRHKRIETEVASAR